MRNGNKWFRAFWQVFQTFACEDYPEINKSYLRADSRIECGTSTHTAYKIYAAIMIFICERIIHDSNASVDEASVPTLLMMARFVTDFC